MNRDGILRRLVLRLRHRGARTRHRALQRGLRRLAARLFGQSPACPRPVPGPMRGPVPSHLGLDVVSLPRLSYRTPLPSTQYTDQPCPHILELFSFQLSRSVRGACPRDPSLAAKERLQRGGTRSQSTAGGTATARHRRYASSPTQPSLPRTLLYSGTVLLQSPVELLPRQCWHFQAIDGASLAIPRPRLRPMAA
jgi:hypothetical protein